MYQPIFILFGFLALCAGLVCCLFGAMIFKDKPRGWIEYAAGGMEFFIGVPMVVGALFMFRAAF